MFPPPDFESGASTNSATGARRADHTGGSGGVNAEVGAGSEESDAFVMSRFACAIDFGAGSGYRDARAAQAPERQARERNDLGWAVRRPAMQGRGGQSGSGSAHASFDAFT